LDIDTIDDGYPCHMRVLFDEQTFIKVQGMKFHIDFTSNRDQAGYRLAYPRTKHELRPLKGGGWANEMKRRTEDIQPIRIVGKGGKAESIRPLDENKTLFKTFSEIKSPDDVLDFVNRFGPLTGDTGVVPEILHEAERMSKFVKAKKNAGATVRAYFPLVRPTVYLSIDRVKDSSNLKLVPSTLLDALFLQLADSVSSGAELRQCHYEHCKEWFEVGPGTGRRLDAKFCSDEHRTAHHNRRKGKKR
jgi:hypothetical protein